MSVLEDVLRLGVLISYLDGRTLFYLSAFIEDDGLLHQCEIDTIYWWAVIE